MTITAPEPSLADEFDPASIPTDELTHAEILALASIEEQEEFFGRITEEQAAALQWDWEFFARRDQLPPPGDWGTWFVMEGRGTGKALALDTPIPTPDGWTTMGELRVGDLLFDEAGRPCRVTFATEVQLGRRCRRVAFSDGSSIVADADHRWVTETARARKASARRLPPERLSRLWVPRDPSLGPQVRTTEEIAATLTIGYRQDRNHSIRVASPLLTAPADLPIHPYVLGAWLGDGSSREAAITVSDADLPEMMERLRSVGIGSFGAARRRPGSNCVTVPIGSAPPRRGPDGRMMANDSLHSALKALGVWRNKHVPPAYLRASMGQRISLLQGLMDTDGTVDARASGQVEFDNTNERLADAVYELVVSLGWQATRGKKRALLDGVDHGVMYRVLFNPDQPVFRLTRKAQRQRLPDGPQSSRRRRRYIVSADVVASVPVRCITVDSPSHLFLAGEAMIPTHNTRTGSEWVRKKGPNAPEGVLIGANPRDVRDLMIEGRSGILTRSPNWERPKYEPSKLKLTWPNGAIAHIRSAEDPESIRGLSADWAWCDEIAKWRFLQECWDMLRLALREGEHPQTLVTTTPKPLPLIQRFHEGRWPRLVKSPPVSTYRNRANLSRDFIEELLVTFEGTRLGAQELHAKMLRDVEGALWNWKMIEAARWAGTWTEGRSPWGDHTPNLPTMKRKVCAVDPSGSSRGAETGIVVSAIDKGRPPIAYVLADRSIRGNPYQWGRAALRAYFDFECNLMIGETNYGGEMVEHVIKTIPAETDPKTGREYPAGDMVRFDDVKAGIGKKLRAEPIVGLYEQNLRGFRRVYHVGTFGDLEDQYTTWVPDESPTSPDRLDAAVWGLHYLIAGKTFKSQQSAASALTNLTMG